MMPTARMGHIRPIRFPGASRGFARHFRHFKAFRSAEQAEAVVGLVFFHALPGYRLHHRDLLFHQKDEQLFLPFFIGRMCEAVLQQGPPWSEIDRIVRGAGARLNDYIGYRPVAVLQSTKKSSPTPRSGCVRFRYIYAGPA